MSTIYEKALKLLKIRPHHSEELARKLKLRGFERAQIVEVIKKLQEENLIDNEQFAQMYLDELIRNKSFGFYMLKAKLMQRGIAGAEAESLLREKLSIEDEKQIALKVVEKEERIGKGVDKIKLSQKLSRKGFRNDVIRSVI